MSFRHYCNMKLRQHQILTPKLFDKIVRDEIERHVLPEYEKIKRITMPFGDDYLLYVTTEIEADHFNIINRIRRLEAGLNYSI
jgi:hypothetical protein